MKQRNISKGIYSLYVIMFMLMIPIGDLWAQDPLNISGKVVDVNNEPLIGATVQVKGKQTGTITNIEGRFSVKVQAKDILVISYMGYTSQEMIASKANGATITLVEDGKTLEEVVVVGYATQKKVNLTGSVSTVNLTEQAESRPMTSLSTGLAGLSSGLYVNQGSARPNNDGATLLIRGQGTLNNSSPLIIIDGAEGNINEVNPQDVESVSVLKDASSSAIYGSRAANGVILITTKKGSEGKASISYNGYVSFQKPSNTIETVYNYADYMEYYNEAAYNVDPTAMPVYSERKIAEWRVHPNEPYLYPNTKWEDEVFSTGVSTNHNLSFSVGNQKLKAFGSVAYLNNPGIVENSAYERFTARLNVNAELKPWITMGMNISGLKSNAEMGSKYMSSLFSNISSPGIVYRHPDGRYGSAENLEENQQVQSPLYHLNMYQGDIEVNNFTSRFWTNIKVFKGLNIEASYTYRRNNSQEEETPVYADRWSFQSKTITQMAAGRTFVRNKNWTNTHHVADVVARYQKTFFDKLDVGILVGASQEKDNVKWFEAKRYDLLADNLSVINGATGDSETSGAATDWVMRSYFGRINLSWADKYLFEGNIRRDGSSRFHKDHRWGTFPSFSLGWRMSEENFMKSIKWLDMLKLRLSWGALGNNVVDNYEYQSVYNKDNYVLGNSVVPGLAQIQLANAMVSWETTYVTNIGLDFSLFGSKLDGTIELFNKDTHDILIDLPAPLLVGNASIPTQNAARVRNRGVEMNLKWNHRIGKVNYFVGGNFTFIDNEVTRFKGEERSISGTNMIQEGYPINIQYVLAVDRILQTDEDMLFVEKMIKDAPLDPTTGQRVNPFASYGTPKKGDFLYKDLNGDGVIDDNDKYAVGHGLAPRLTYGFSLGAEWNGFDFSCLFQGNAGLQVYWQDKFYMGYINYGDVINKEIAEGAWREGRTNATYPRLLTGLNTLNAQPSDFWVQNKSYLRLKNVQIGYKIPKKLLQKLDISQLRLYTSLENMLTFTSYKGIDPEISGTTYPTMKQITVGVNVVF